MSWAIDLASSANLIMKARSAGTLRAKKFLNLPRAKAEPDDPDGAYMLRCFRANQILSSLVRGSIQMGYSRDTFNPETYIKRGQSTKEMHLSCLCVLSEITPKLTGCESFSLIRPSPTGPTEFSYIDPAGIVMMEKSQGHVCNIQVPAKMTDKVVKRKIGKEKNPAAGQTSIMDASITPEQRERLGRPSNVKGSSSGRGDTRRVSWNANTYIDKGEKGKGKGKTPEEMEEVREDARDRLRRWERDNHGRQSVLRSCLWHWLCASDLHSWPPTISISSVTLCFRDVISGDRH